MEIKSQLCMASQNDSSDKLEYVKILPDEINGLDTCYIKIPPGKTYHHASKLNTISIFLFFSGECRIQEEKNKIGINEVSVYVPAEQNELSFSAGNETCQILESRLHLLDEDHALLKTNAEKFPFRMKYSLAPKYKEEIKSPKTINRMLIPENLIPRFCMGSVETSGADKIEKHRHPMLEQLFFGLPGNDCIVTADNQSVEFKENILLHIPLGSLHGVSVNEGKSLHYVWIDYFKSQAEMDYISKYHIMNE